MRWTRTTTCRPSGAITTSPTMSWKSWASKLIILGIDPGLATTGWGIIVAEGSRLSHVANGRIKTDAALPLALRLAMLAEKLNELVSAHQIRDAAMEEIFVNKNPQSTLKLAQARG